MSLHSEKLVAHFRRAGWLPVSDEALESWVGGHAARAANQHQNRDAFPVLPEITELKKFIESNTEMYIGFNRMLHEKLSPFSKHIPHYERLLDIINELIQKAPLYGEIGPPVLMVLTHAMNTHGGFSTFLNQELNVHFKRLFDKWSAFLSSPASCNVLGTGEDEWFGKPALAAMVENYDGVPFGELFVCDPAAKYFGFASYEAFFSRAFRPGIRPVQFQENADIISAACESQLYNIAKNVKERDTFWLKGEPYSLVDMFNHDEFVPQFVGGTVFQGFQQVTGYHRWHSPVTGTIKKITHIPGAYFCQSPETLHSPDGTNPYLHCLAFFTAVNTRTLIFVEASNPNIGLMCFIAIGMAEVSSLEATVTEGQRVERGDELGMFHFGGSSHAVVFGPKVNIKFFDGRNAVGDHIQVRAAIGSVH